MGEREYAEHVDAAAGLPVATRIRSFAGKCLAHALMRELVRAPLLLKKTESPSHSPEAIKLRWGTPPPPANKHVIFLFSHPHSALVSCFPLQWGPAALCFSHRTPSLRLRSASGWPLRWSLATMGMRRGPRVCSGRSMEGSGRTSLPPRSPLTRPREGFRATRAPSRL